jgi:integrase
MWWAHVGSEIDGTAKAWIVPRERLKGGKEHRVPLSQDALDIIEGMSGLDPVVVFTGVRDGRPSLA